MRHTRNPRSSSFLVRAAVIVGLISMVSTACSSSATKSTGTGTADQTSMTSTERPSYYPDGYEEIVAAAKKEDGGLVMNTSSDSTNLIPIFKAFKKRYPFVTSIKNLNIHQEAIYQKALTAHNSGNRGTADLLQLQSAIGRTVIKENKEILRAYRSPEKGHVPELFKAGVPYIYVYALNPMLTVYNTALVGKAIDSHASVAKLLSSSNGKDLGHCMRGIDSAFGLLIHNSLVRLHPSIWQDYQAIVPDAKIEDSSGSMLTKLETGEYAVCSGLHPASATPVIRKSAGLLKGFMPKDGTAFMGTGMAISASAPHPYTAKLFLDFILSKRGQAAVATGGYKPIRDVELSSEDKKFTYAHALKSIGESNTAIIGFKSPRKNEISEFKSRWKALVR